MKAYRLLENGLSFLRNSLAAGDQLAHRLLTLPLESGDIFTLLPDDVQPENASLQHGFRSSAKPEERGSFLKLVDSYLSITASAVVMELGSLTLEEADRFYSKAKFPTFLVANSDRICGDDTGKNGKAMAVYGYVDSYQSSDEMIQELISERWAFGAVGCIASLELGRLDRNVVQEFSLIETLVERTQTIIVFAFDEEGYIYWTRDDENAFIKSVRAIAVEAVIRSL